LSFGFCPEDFLFLDVVIHADAVLDVDHRSEVTAALVFGVDGNVHDLVFLDDHEEGLVLLDAGAVVTEPISGSALAGKAQRAGSGRGQQAELFAARFLARVASYRLENWMVNLMF
jgi:hypothetical protein